MAEQSHGPQARRSIRGPGAAALLAVSLAGCQLVPKARPDIPPEEARPEAEAPREEDRGPRLPPEETLNRVAVLVPTSGSNAAVGQSIANAANLALLDAGGERIRITVYDTARGGAAAAANQALAEGNGLFLGPLLAEDVRAVAPVARRAGVPVISYSNDSSVAGGGVYLMGFTPGQSISRVVEHARGAGLERFGALAPANVYGRRASDAMVDSVERERGQLVSMQTYEGGPAGVRAAIARLHGQGDYDAVLIADGGRSAAAAAPLLKSGARARVRLLGTELWATETGLVRTPALRGAWYASVADSMFNQLRTR
ncbi:MAG TPA: penicillin-binding protein activator, partial [Allosphingosinicella sp.]|nr:penicillin-binding protein activator [Allosphingosinicella sp.]